MLTLHWFWYPGGANGRNQWYPRALGWHCKMGKQLRVKGHSATMNYSRIIEKTPLELKESKKREGNIVRYPQTAIKEHTWIQRDSKFASHRGLKSHLSLYFWTYLELVIRPGEYDVLHNWEIIKILHNILRTPNVYFVSFSIALLLYWFLIFNAGFLFCAPSSL